MTKSTFPDAWLQALATEKVVELNREATKDFVTVEKKVLDTLQKNNLDLMEKLETTKEALRFYADETHYQKECVDSRVGAIEEVIIDNGGIARNALEDIEK